MADKSYISKVTLPNGSEYYVKDSDARDLIATIQSGSVVWGGVTTTALTDGSTTSTITIDGKSVKATKGLMVAYTPTGETNAREFIFNGTIWQELGGLGLLKALAYKDSASAEYTPSGSNGSSSVTFAGGTSDVVLGESTKFSATGTDVSFGTHSTATVLKSDVTATVPKTSSTTKYLKGTSGTTGTKSINQVTGAGVTGSSAVWTATVASGSENLVFSWTTNTPTTPCSYGSVTVGSGGDSVLTGLSTADTTSTGALAYVSSVGTSGTDSVTFSTTGHTASAITGLGTISVTNPTISADSTDRVTAITSIGTGTAAAQTFTGSKATITVS